MKGENYVQYKTFPTKGSVPRPVSFFISLSTSHIYALSLPFHFRISTPYPVARFTLPFSIHAFSLLIPLALFVIFPLSISVVVPVSLSRALPVFTGAVFTLPLSTVGAVARSISSLPRPWSFPSWTVTLVLNAGEGVLQWSNQDLAAVVVGNLERKFIE